MACKFKRVYSAIYQIVLPIGSIVFFLNLALLEEKSESNLKFLSEK